MSIKVHENYALGGGDQEDEDKDDEEESKAKEESEILQAEEQEGEKDLDRSFGDEVGFEEEAKEELPVIEKLNIFDNPKKQGSP